MAITGIPPNGWGGGYGAPPPPTHHANIHFLEATQSGPYPGCTPALVHIAIGNGSMMAIGNGNNQPQVNTPVPHGSYHPEPQPLGWSTTGANSPIYSAIGGFGGTINAWGECQDTWDFEFQLRDANGNGVEIDSPPMTGPPPWLGTFNPAQMQFLTTFLSTSTNSNPNPGTPTSFIYTYSFNSPGGNPHSIAFNYLLDPGDYTLEIWDMKCSCYHTSLNQSPNPEYHSLPLGHTSNMPHGFGLLPFTVPGAVGCGPPPGPVKWLCHGDYHCREIGVQGGISDYDAMWNIWNMAKNMWPSGGNFGWTESTSQHPPSGATYMESDQSVDLTRPGGILDGLQPYTIQTVNLGSTTNPIWQTNQIPNTNITLSQYISVLPVNIGAAIPNMPATPVSNAWTIAQNVPGGGATTYSPINQNHPQAPLWNPPPNATPGPNIVGGYTSYRGVVIPPIGATTTTSLDNTFHGTPTWIPFHDSLSSCIACCGDVSHQFDENLQINPYYGPYMTPPGWNDPNLPTPSQNAGFEAWLNGANPWNMVLPREGGQVQLYKFYNGANMCGGTWID